VVFWAPGPSGAPRDIDMVGNLFAEVAMRNRAEAGDMGAATL
jgi:hypothetical protein